MRSAPRPRKPARDRGLPKGADGIRIVCRNRKARERFTIEKTFEAGLVLEGTEVKSLREGHADLADSYAAIRDGEVVLLNLHIAPYRHGGYVNHPPRRPRRLLLHRREIERLTGRVLERGYTLVPLALYFRRGWAKVELALAKGKTGLDRREEIRRRDAEREARREGRQR